jgi:hypothetical protein
MLQAFTAPSLKPSGLSWRSMPNSVNGAGHSSMIKCMWPLLMLLCVQLQAIQVNAQTVTKRA